MAINPSSLSPAIYLSGLPNDGVHVTSGSLTSWVDKVASYNFTPSTGSSGIAAFNDGSVGEPPGIWAVSACGGSFFRGWDAHGSLPSFSNANGYTQYLLAGGLNSNPDAVWGPRWPSGANGTGLLFQGPTFDGSGGAIYFGDSAPGKIIVTSTNGGKTTGIVTPTNQVVYDLWTLVSDGSANTTLYRNGVKGPVINTGVVGLGTNLVFGGPSSGLTFVCALISSYLLYTAQHTPGQIAGIHAWFRAKYGVS